MLGLLMREKMVKGRTLFRDSKIGRECYCVMIVSSSSMEYARNIQDTVFS